MTDLPDNLTVRVLLHTYRVTHEIPDDLPIKNGKPELVGRCDEDREIIWIWDGLNPMVQRKTLLHEVLHAAGYISDVHGNERTTVEAHTCAIAEPLLAILRNNPELVAYLLEGSQAERVTVERSIFAHPLITIDPNGTAEPNVHVTGAMDFSQWTAAQPDDLHLTDPRTEGKKP